MSGEIRIKLSKIIKMVVSLLIFCGISIFWVFYFLNKTDQRAANPQEVLGTHGKEFDMEHQNTEKLLRNIETIEIGNKSNNDDEFSNTAKGNNITVIPPCVVLEASKSMETNHCQTKDGTC